MKVIFTEMIQIGTQKFEKGITYTSSDELVIEDLNEYFIIIILKGIRYDIPKRYITII